MWRTITMTSLAAGLLMAQAGFAQVPAGVPAGSTGLCKDGSYWSGATKQGACHGHKGVQTWFGAVTTAPAAAAPAASTPAASAPAAPAPAAAAVPAAAAAVAAPAAAAASKGSTAITSAAPGGGGGQVWVNKSSKVYHCSSDRYYGKTKNGAYMAEADAIAQGFHADHGKSCH